MDPIGAREALWTDLVRAAEADERIVAAAAVGSSATGGDRWSDIDLTMAVKSGVDLAVVLEEWTHLMTGVAGAAVLFDIVAGPSTYRVFLAPEALQVDLSFTPEEQFAARGPRFRQLFGAPAQENWSRPPDPDHQFGLGVHHLLRAFVCIERGRLWQAHHWLHEARSQAMVLECDRMGLDVSHARGFDDLPPKILDRYLETIAPGLNPADLRRALERSARLLFDEAEGRCPAWAGARASLAPVIDFERESEH